MPNASGTIAQTLTLAQVGAPGWGWALAAALGLVVGIGVGAGASILLGRAGVRKAQEEAERITRQAEADARAAVERAEIEAEKTALERKERADSEIEAVRAQVRDQERRLTKREDLLDRKEETLVQRDQTLTQRTEEVERARQRVAERDGELVRLVGKQTEELHRLSQLSREQATELLLERVEDQCRSEVGKRVRQINEEAEEQARGRAREVVLQAIQRYATETASESTVRTVDIPSDDMKGRIIGREGRNIRAIEKVTGVDIIVDDTPGVIIVSCFDRVRQAVAVESLTRLIADGRMHPTRIEEVVEKVRAEIEEKVVKAGKDSAAEVNLRGFSPKVLEAMGKLHYRTSYGQNVLRHSIEVAYFSQLIADQLGLDGRLARRCGFLHDIGKAMDHEMEGGHPKIGMEFAKLHGEKDEAVLNAIGGHHADIPATTFYTPIVMAADAVSSARPGARRESMERYVQRLNELQDIALAQPGVTEAHAIQAGREVRVMIDAARASDDEAYLIAHNIAKRISDEMTFPGEIRVTVLRETRAIEIAR